MVRFILDKTSRTYIGQRELDRLGLLNVEDRVTQLKLNHVFKVVHGLTPKYIVIISPVFLTDTLQYKAKSF